MLLTTFVLPVVYAIFLWWFMTGVIMIVYARSRWILRLYFFCATLLLMAALYCIYVTSNLANPLFVYIAVTCGVISWGWQVAAYYLGFVTGPQQTNSPENVSGAQSPIQRFRAALNFSLYHELVVILVGLIIFVLTWGKPNGWGFWIYLALGLMHTSAKVSVFLGVRNFRVEFLPSRLHHLERLLSKRPTNEFLPLSVVLASSIALLLVYQGITPAALPAERVGYLLVATMIALGVLEHCLLVVPLPMTLWGWGLRSLSDSSDPDPRAD